MNTKNVIIIGAGIGGLASAVRLLSRGYNVIIYEKESSIGGKVNILETKHFKFDLTASILMMPKEYKEIFSYANRDYKDYISLIKLDPIYRVFFSDKSKYDFSTDLTKLSEVLESFSKKDFHGYLKLLEEVYNKYNIAYENFLHKSFNKPQDFFNPKTLTKALEINTLTNTYHYISKYLNSDKLKNYISFQAMYVGISPFNGPNIYTLVPVTSQLYGIWYIKGGMYSFITALKKLIDELGGTIKTELPVEEIIFSGDKAAGVKSKEGVEKADIVVCNADFAYSMNNLIKYSKAKGDYTDKKLSNLKYSCSTFILYLGLKKKYPELSVHNIYIGEDFKANIEAPFKGMLSPNPSLYIYCPSRIDNSMAYGKKEALNVTLRVPNLSFDIKWNTNTIKTIRDRIIRIISNLKGLEDIEDNILYESFFTPENLQSAFNCYYGNAFGISHTLSLTNYFRPHIKSPTVKNLYFTGGSIQPGTGVSMVLISSKNLVEDIIKYE